MIKFLIDFSIYLSETDDTFSKSGSPTSHNLTSFFLSLNIEKAFIRFSMPLSFKNLPTKVTITGGYGGSSRNE